jgi:hypothetical protein
MAHERNMKTKEDGKGKAEEVKKEKNRRPGDCSPIVDSSF